MDLSEKVSRLASCELMKGVSADGLREAGEAAELVEFGQGEKLLSPSRRGRIGFIVSGCAKVVKPSGNGYVSMSLLRAGDIFGAASLMGGKLPSTEATALKPVSALIFDEEAFIRLMERHFEITLNYCRYLISRIRFLTERVECMAGGTAAEKLMRYLVQNEEKGSVHIPFGMDALAKALSLSRASLYRALDELENSGRISRSGYEIRLL